MNVDRPLPRSPITATRRTCFSDMILWRLQRKLLHEYKLQTSFAEEPEFGYD